MCHYRIWDRDYNDGLCKADSMWMPNCVNNHNGDRQWRWHIYGWEWQCHQMRLVYELCMCAWTNGRDITHQPNCQLAKNNMVGHPGKSGLSLLSFCGILSLIVGGQHTGHCQYHILSIFCIHDNTLASDLVWLVSVRVTFREYFASVTVFLSQIFIVWEIK